MELYLLLCLELVREYTCKSQNVPPLFQKKCGYSNTIREKAREAIRNSVLFPESWISNKGRNKKDRFSHQFFTCPRRAMLE